VTRDLKTVVYHDFSLSELGADIPIHDLTLDQYRHASDLQEPRGMAAVGLNITGHVLRDPPQKQRSWSTGEESKLLSAQLRHRLRHTVDFKNKGFKPNTRGDFVQGPLTTLEELLTGLPQGIGFNIEISMRSQWGLLV
jgi:glycerophosphodiester phosphodiesterase